MKKTLLRVATASIAVTCLAWAQPPQGAKETVVIEESTKTAAPKPKDSLPAPGTAPKPKVQRDPFAPPGVGTSTAPATLKPTKAAAEANAAAKPAADGSTTLTEPEPEVDPPKVEVVGIVHSGTGNRAIVKGPNSTFIVKAGDKLGDYRVASVEKRSVIFKFKDKKFPIKMEDEFSAKK